MTTRLSVMILCTFIVYQSSLITLPAAGADEKKSDGAKITFQGQVSGIFAKHCNKCHNSERPRGDLDLTSYPAMMQGGANGKAVVAGKSADSLLLALINHLEAPKMPPGNKKIPQADIDTIQKWIDGGLIESLGTGPASIVQSKPVPVNLDGLVSPAAFSHLTPITGLAVSPNAPLVALSGKKQVLIYDLVAGKLLGGLAYPEGEVHSLRFSADGKLLLAAGGTGGESGAVIGYEVGTWKRLFKIVDATDAVLSADISRDKKCVVFGGPSKLVKVASVPDGKILHSFRKPTDWVLSVGFSPEGLLVAAGDRFGGLYVWSREIGHRVFHAAWTYQGCHQIWVDVGFQFFGHVQ